MANQAKTVIRVFEDGEIQGEIITAGSQKCDNVAEIFTAFGSGRNQTTKEDGDTKDVFENVS